jgi:hypothetical protein
MERGADVRQRIAVAVAQQIGPNAAARACRARGPAHWPTVADRAARPLHDGDRAAERRYKCRKQFPRQGASIADPALVVIVVALAHGHPAHRRVAGRHWTEKREQPFRRCRNYGAPIAIEGTITCWSLTDSYNERRLGGLDRHHPGAVHGGGNHAHSASERWSAWPSGQEKRRSANENASASTHIAIAIAAVQRANVR